MEPLKGTAPRRATQIRAELLRFAGSLWIIPCVVALTGCTTERPSSPRVVKVADAELDVRAELNRAGARKVAMASIQAGQRAYPPTFFLPSGKLLAVTFRDGSVSDLKLCSNSDQPRDEWVWTEVQAVQLTE